MGPDLMPGQYCPATHQHGAVEMLSGNVQYIHGFSVHDSQNIPAAVDMKLDYLPGPVGQAVGEVELTVVEQTVGRENGLEGAPGLQQKY